MSTVKSSPSRRNSPATPCRSPQIIVASAVALSVCAAPALAQTTAAPAAGQSATTAVKTLNDRVTEATAALKTAAGSTAVKVPTEPERTIIEAVLKLPADDTVSSASAGIASIKSGTLAIKKVTSSVKTHLTEMGKAQQTAALATLKQKTEALTSLKDEPGYAALDEAVRTAADAALTQAANAKKDQALVDTWLDDENTDGSIAHALVGFYDYGKVVTEAVKTSRGPLGEVSLDENKTLDAGDIRTKLLSGLPQFASSLALSSDLAKAKSDLTEAVTTANALEPKREEVGKRFTKFTEAADAVADDTDKRVKALPKWFTAVADDVKLHTATTITAANAVRTSRPFAYQEGRNTGDVQSKYIGEVDRLQTLWNAARDNFAAKNGTTAKAVDENLKTLQGNRNDLNINLAVLSSLLSGKVRNFIADQVRLFYFLDIPRLIKAINPTAHVFDPTAEQDVNKATQARRNLTKKDQELSEQRGQVADLTTRVQRIQTEIRRAEQDVARTDRALNRALGQQDALNDKKNDLANKLTGDGLSDAEKKQIKAQIDENNTRIEEYKKVTEAAQNDSTNAHAQQDKLLDEQKGLPAELEQAKTALKEAQRRVSTARQEMQSLAQDESDLFAAARDNAPYFVAEPIADDPDPARRVYLFAYPDSKTVYIRGNRDDVKAVREVIAQFDKPAPQALLTFYTMQINGDDGKKDSNLENFLRYGTRRHGNNEDDVSKAIRIIEDNIDNVRIGTSEVEEYLRQAINEEINDVARNIAATTKDDDFPLRDRLARYGFYAPAVSRELGFLWPNQSQFNPGASPATNRVKNTDVRKQQEKSSANDGTDNIAPPNRPRSSNTLQDDLKEATRATEWLTSYTLPDPTRLTTLGEMLFTVSLANRDSREKILTNFTLKMAGYKFHAQMLDYTLPKTADAPDIRTANQGLTEGRDTLQQAKSDYVEYVMATKDDADFQSTKNELDTAIAKASTALAAMQPSQAPTDPLTPAQKQAVSEFDTAAATALQKLQKTSLHLRSLTQEALTSDRVDAEKKNKKKLSQRCHGSQPQYLSYAVFTDRSRQSRRTTVTSKH